MHKINGIGGFFFRANDPEGLEEWYRIHFGLNDGSPVWAQSAGYTVFKPSAADTDYYAADKSWMLNFRVDDMDASIAHFRDAGIEVITKPEWDSEIGRFARVHDPEGNAIELWEPASPSQ